MFSTRTFGGEDILAIAAMDFHAGRFAEAQRGCEAALKLLPDDGNVLYLLGLTEVELGNADTGIRLIERSIAQDTGRVDRARGLALALTKVRRLDEAVRVLGQAVMRAPENAEAFRALIETSLTAVDRPVSSTPPPATAGMDDGRSVSIVVCSIDPQKAKNIRAHYERLFAGRRFEIIQIDDARSLCEGYNRGFSRSSGDIVIFSHDDIEIVSPDFPARLLAHLGTNDLVGVAGATQLIGANWNSAGWPRVHGCVVHLERDGNGFFFHCFGPPPTGVVQALDGLFIAAKRKVCETIEFDSATFDGFHFYDLDFSYRAFLAGFRIAIPWDILIVHASWGRSDAAWQKYAKKFAAKYGAETIARVSPPPVNWPIVPFSDRARMIAFHEIMARAQGIAVS